MGAVSLAPSLLLLYRNFAYERNNYIYSLLHKSGCSKLVQILPFHVFSKACLALLRLHGNVADGRADLVFPAVKLRGERHVVQKKTGARAIHEYLSTRNRAARREKRGDTARMVTPHATTRTVISKATSGQATKPYDDARGREIYCIKCSSCGRRLSTSSFENGNLNIVPIFVASFFGAAKKKLYYFILCLFALVHTFQWWAHGLVYKRVKRYKHHTICSAPCRRPCLVLRPQGYVTKSS